MNRYHHAGSPTVTGSFGPIVAVTPMRHVSGNGHGEHVRISCVGGMSLEVSSGWLSDLFARGSKALHSLPDVECSGALADLGDQ